MINLALIDDHPIFRNGFRLLFEHSDQDIINLVFANDCASFYEYLNNPESKNIDVVLIDFQMPNINGIEVIENLSVNTPSLKSILFSSYYGGYLIESAIEKGAKSCIAKNTNFQDLLKIIEEVHTSGYYISCDFPQKSIQFLKENKKYFPQYNFSIKITKREKDVAILIAQGYSYKEIADRLNISKRTVELRKESGLSQSELANIAGLEKSNLSVIENGKSNPQILTLVKLSSALKVDLSDLMNLNFEYNTFLESKAEYTPRKHDKK